MTLEIQAVTKTIKGVDVLKNITFRVPSGRVVGLSGINGSGKTMLMRVICGLIRPSSGMVTINGMQLGRDIAFPPSIGALIENPAFLDSRTGFNNLQLLASIKGIADSPRIAETLRFVGLDPNDKRKFRKYSLGMKQRLGLAAAIMESPEIVVLDEPTNALDTEGISMLKQLVISQKKRGAAVIISCHDATILRELSDEIIYMEDGRILSRELAKEIQ